MTLKVGDLVKHRYLNYGEGKIIRIKENSFFPFVIDFPNGEESFSELYLVVVEKKDKAK